MEFYTYCSVIRNKIVYRGYKDGSPVLEEIGDYKPYVFIHDRKDTGSEWKSLYGGFPLKKKEFKSLRDAKEFLDTHSDLENFNIHGITKWQYQYISDKFKGDIDFNVNDVDLLFFDLEVVDPTNRIKGFPNVQKAEVPIVMISFYSTKRKKVQVWGLKDYETSPEDGFKYRKFDDEREMLHYFVAYLASTKPDVLSGWNTSSFDIPYLINRLTNIFGSEFVKQISPFGKIDAREMKDDFGNEVTEFDVAGVVDLDYLRLYKKFGTYSAKESYTLDFIASEELGLNKVKMPGRSFYDSYTNYFEDFVRYNAWDTELVVKLDVKMRLVELAFGLAYLYKCNLSDIYKTVVPWEVFIYNYLAERKIVIPPKSDKESEQFEGAWVKETRPGKYGWCMSFDFASLYPSIIRQWNISPECLIEEKADIGVESWLNEDTAALEASARAKELNCTIAANGTMYKKDKQGFLPQLMAYVMNGRKIAKKEMLRLEQEYQTTKDPSLLPRIAALNNRQMAFKIAANSAYGAIGNKGFLYFNYLMAEAITLTGQVSDKHLAKMLNIKMNKLLKTTDFDYIMMADTDSVYLDCEELVQRTCGGKSRDEIVVFLDDFGEKICQPVINASIDHIFDLTNAFEKVMGSKREAIASKTIVRAKKNYAMYVHNSEGVSYNPPKLKSMGIEIVRSTTPAWCRDKLKSALKIMFEGTEQDIQKFYAEAKKEFYALPIESIAQNKGVNDISKWKTHDASLYKKGCPMHVRAAILFNKHMSKKDWFMEIHNGDKIKIVFLREPNPTRENVIAFPSADSLPDDSGLLDYIDYGTQFEKVFASPLRSLTDLAKWKLEHRVTFDDLFGDDEEDDSQKVPYFDDEDWMGDEDSQPYTE